LRNRLLAQANPALDLVDAHARSYYWSMAEGAWASDLAFASPAALAELAPRLFRHAWLNFASADVMRFLGSKAVRDHGPHGNCTGEVVTDLKRRPEGPRIKHRLKRNWIKRDEQQGAVRRVETVINDPRDMNVYRAQEGDADGPKSWQRVRQGVADLHRRAAIRQAATDRYVERGLNPLAADDARVLEAVNRGEFARNGCRNRDLRGLLFPKPAVDGTAQRRQSAAITRPLRLLRAHGLIPKAPQTHR